jgi:hypothetical protein
MKRLRENNYARKDGSIRAGLGKMADHLKTQRMTFRAALREARTDISREFCAACLARRTSTSACEELLRRGKVKVAIRLLSAADNDPAAIPESGETDKGTRLDIVKLILENMMRKRKGAPSTEKVKHFMEGLRILGGESVYNYVSANLGLHGERAIRRETKKAQGETSLRHGLVESNFILVGGVYKAFIAGHPHLEGIRVLATLVEDETGVDGRWAYDLATGELIGGCGSLCAAKCNTIKQCRHLNCGDPHACDDDPTKTGMVVGEDEVAYKALLEFVAANRLGTHLRLVIVNPLDKRLPRLPVLMTATCNT